MNLFKHIGSRGWLGTALRNLTFGLHPKTTDAGTEPDHPDWCTAHSRLYAWSQAARPAQTWAVAGDLAQSWSVQATAGHVWTVGAQPVYQWTATATGGDCE